MYYKYLLYSLIKLFLSQPTSFTFYLFLIPIPLGGRGGVSKQLSHPGCQLLG